MSNHTPGPWIWYKSSDRGIFIRTEYEYHYEAPIWNNERKCYQGTRPVKNTLLLAELYEASNKAYTTKHDEAVANARLIAAAPDLLEALINALPMLHTGDELPISYYADKKGVLGDALRAITKAKGEQ